MPSLSPALAQKASAQRWRMSFTHRHDAFPPSAIIIEAESVLDVIEQACNKAELGNWFARS